MADFENCYIRITEPIIDGKDIFRLHDESGITIEISCVLAKERGHQIDWGGFIQEASKRKWDLQSLSKRIESAMLDAGFQMWIIKLQQNRLCGFLS